MNKYRTLQQLGDGSFGSVIQAENLESGETVSISSYPLACLHVSSTLNSIVHIFHDKNIAMNLGLYLNSPSACHC